MMTWGQGAYPKYDPARDKQVLFVVNYRDGSRAFTRVRPELAIFGSSPGVWKVARERQTRGELPPGEIANLIRVR